MTSASSDFYRRVGIVCRRIPEGTVATYGQIALLCGKPKNSRQVGYALREGLAGEVPAYKVVNSKGLLSGAFHFETADLQKLLLTEDGVEVSWTPEGWKVDLKRFGWKNTMEEALILQAEFGDGVNPLRQKDGYTLVELLIVLVVLITLLSVGAGAYAGFTERAKRAELYEKAHLVLGAIRACEAEYGYGDGMTFQELEDGGILAAPNKKESILYPYVGKTTEDCRNYTVRFVMLDSGRLKIDGFTYETSDGAVTWDASEGMKVEKLAGKRK